METKILELSKDALLHCCYVLAMADELEYGDVRQHAIDMQLRFEVGKKLYAYLVKWPFRGVQRLKISELAFLERMILDYEEQELHELTCAREVLAQVQPKLPPIQKSTPL